MSEWKQVVAYEFIEINPKEILKKGSIAPKISMDMLKPFTRKVSSYIEEPYKGGTKFRNQDTIMARITPCLENGKTSMVDILPAAAVGFGSTEYIVFRARPEISDPKFIYYLACSNAIRDIAIKSMVGSSGRQRVQQSVVNNIEIRVPELKEQQKIASVLSSLDDKIELNNAINENLEQQAQLVFKKEFIDIPSTPIGWEHGNLLEIADYLNGLAMQKFRPQTDEVGIPVLKIKELRQGSCDSSSEFCSPNIKPEYFIYNGDVVFSWSGSLLVDFWCGEKCGLNQHLFKVTSKKHEKWFYYSWTNYHLQKFIAIASDMATTMGHIKREELSKSDVLIPNEEDYIRIGSILQPLYDIIISNRIENRKLASIRDSLLPQLMSGEVDVSEVTP